MLWSWGPIVWEVMPLNVHEYEELGRTDFAKKEVAGTRPVYEFVGEDDEEMTFHGRIHPAKVGGLSEMEAFEALRKTGVPQKLTRGDGVSKGWYGCTRLQRTSKHLLGDGVGQVIVYEMHFIRMDIPSGEEYFSTLYGLAGQGSAKSV